MKIKKFVAKSVPVAMQMIKTEFGEDAIILNQKKIKSKAHPDWINAIEVTAAIDNKEESEKAVSSFSAKLNYHENKQTATPPSNNYQIEILQKDVDSINEKMEMLINHIKFESLMHIPKILQKKAKNLIQNDVHPTIANKLVEDIHTNLKGEELLESELIDDKLINKN